jgi:hypothetical protein
MYFNGKVLTVQKTSVREIFRSVVVIGACFKGMTALERD